MTNVEMKQLTAYLYPLLKGGIDDRYLIKMAFLKDITLDNDIVFISQEKCDKELFAAILVALKTAPNYYTIDSYRLVNIDGINASDSSFNTLYDLTVPRVLFIRCGISDRDLSEKLKQYIGNCIDIIVDARSSKGLRTFVFNFGTKDTFKKYNCNLLDNFVTISFSYNEECNHGY
jgi:hypothetical protein